MKIYVKSNTSSLNIDELANSLSKHIDEVGKSKWSAKDIYEYFAGEGIKLSLEDIIQVWNACPNPICACELLGCDKTIEATSDLEANTSGFKMDFIVVYNYSDSIWDIVLDILTDVFEQNGCEILGYSLDEVDYSDVPEYREFDVVQAGVDFKWTVEYDGVAIERQIRNKMEDAGYEVIGNPDFYSLD